MRLSGEREKAETFADGARYALRDAGTRWRA